MSKFNVGLKTLLSEGLSEPEFYGDLVYKFKKLLGRLDFSFQFRKVITRYRRIGYNLNVMLQSACLVFNPIMADYYAAFFNCTPVGRVSDSTRVCNHVADFNARNKCLTAKLLQQGYRYHKLRKTFSKFYRRHYELISKFNVGLKTFLREGLLEPEFYGDLVYKFKKLIGRNDFSFQFRKIITRYRRIEYNLNVMHA